MIQTCLKIKKLSSEYLESIIKLRRQLHKDPELSFKEYRTSELLIQQANLIGIPNKNIKKICNTGIELIITGEKKQINQSIALRADIDALPIQENKDVFYKRYKKISKTDKINIKDDFVSKNDKKMHACGHDAHAASLIGVLKILNTLKPEFAGSVKFIFQPGEEKLPGGASLMIKEGILQNPAPKYILGQHVMPNILNKKVGFCKNIFTASSDEIKIILTGKSGNLEFADTIIDLIPIISNIIVALQQVVSRKKPPQISSVLSFGSIKSYGKNNRISDQVTLLGTFRSTNEQWRGMAHELIKKTCYNISNIYEADCKVDIIKGYPCLKNDQILTEKIINYSYEYLNKDDILILEPQMFAEDFAYFAEQIPSCFYGIGVKNDDKGINSQLHTPTFDIDENSLETSMGLMSWLTIKLLFELSNS